MRARAVGVLVALTAACSGAPQPPRAGPAGPEIPVVPIVSPARWAYHPPAPGGALAIAEIDAQHCLFTAPGGQRWLVTPGDGAAKTDKKARAGRRTCSGKAEVASVVAPEDLVVVERRGERWLFVGAGGTVYQADSPLGAFARTEAPPIPLVRVTAGAQVMGLSADGTLYAWAADKGFRALPKPGLHLADVAADEKGHVLGLALPEALAASDDGGATWRPFPAPAIGARRLGVTEKGELAAQGLYESMVFKDLGAAPLRTKEQVLATDAETDVEIGPAPSASAVASGRAALDGDRYVEALKPEPANKDRWQLARGKLEGKLDLAPTPDGKECLSVRVALRGNAVAFACVHGRSAGDSVVRIRRSFDFGATWGDAVELAVAENELAGLAIAPDGATLTAGACKDASTTCKPGATVLIRGDARHPTAIVSAAEQLASGAQAPAFSFDGRSAYFLGKRGKDERIALFVSHDAGETFSQRAIAPTPQPATPEKSDDEDEDGPRERDAEPDAVDLDDRTFIRATEDGTVGILVRTNQPIYLLVDDDGRVLQSAAAPNDRSTLAGFGRRVIAVGPPGEGGRDLTLWESSDGGATWEEASSPPSLGQVSTDANLACAAGGCLVGDVLTRVGWGGPAASSPAVTIAEPAAGEVHLLTPITCEIAPSSRWSRIDDLYYNELPRIGDAMRGKAAWSAITHDPTTGAVAVVVANAEGDDPRPSTRQLFGPNAGPHTALYVSQQIEGYAAARVAFPVDPKGAYKPGAPMPNVEIAWENFIEGTSPRARADGAGPFERDDVVVNVNGAFYQPAFLSVAAKGLFFRAHAHPKDQLMTFFDLGGRAAHRVPMTRFPNKGFFGAIAVGSEAVTIDGTPTPIGFVHESAPTGEYTSAILLGLPPRPGAVFSADGREIVAKAIAPLHGEASAIVESEFTYSGKGNAGEAVVVSDPGRGTASATFNPFRENAAPIPVPTVLDLGDRPRPCSAADRANTPRVEARIFTSTTNGKDLRALFPGSRRAVLVVDPPSNRSVGVSAPTTLLTTATIAHGTPSSPCASAHVARSVNGAPPTAVIISGDLKRGWLFRPSTDRATSAKPSPKVGAALEHRPMTCRFDPGAKVPVEALSDPGIRSEKSAQ